MHVIGSLRTYEGAFLYLFLYLVLAYLLKEFNLYGTFNHSKGYRGLFAVNLQYGSMCSLTFQSYIVAGFDPFPVKLRFGKWLTSLLLFFLFLTLKTV